MPRYDGDRLCRPSRGGQAVCPLYLQQKVQASRCILLKPKTASLYLSFSGARGGTARTKLPRGHISTLSWKRQKPAETTTGYGQYTIWIALVRPMSKRKGHHLHTHVGMENSTPSRSAPQAPKGVTTSKTLEESGVPGQLHPCQVGTEWESSSRWEMSPTCHVCPHLVSKRTDQAERKEQKV